jgi:hypothetical protein
MIRGCASAAAKFASPIPTRFFFPGRGLTKGDLVRYRNGKSRADSRDLQVRLQADGIREIAGELADSFLHLLRQRLGEVAHGRERQLRTNWGEMCSPVAPDVFGKETSPSSSSTSFTTSAIRCTEDQGTHSLGVETSCLPMRTVRP